MKPKKLYMILVLVIVLSLINVASATNNKKILVAEGSRICYVGEKQVQLSCDPFVFRGEVYLPIDDVLPAAGITMGWDAETEEIVCSTATDEYRVKMYKSIIKVNGIDTVFNCFPVMYNGVACIGESVIKTISGCIITSNPAITTEYKEFLFSGGSNSWDNNGKIDSLTQEPFTYGGEIYVYADEVLKQMGYTLGWQDDIKALVCVKGKDIHYIISNKNNIWVNDKEYIFDNPSLVIDGKMYISTPMIEKLTGGKVYTNGSFLVKYKRDLLEDTYVTDKYRLPGNSVVSGGGVTVIDGFGMEFLGVKAYNAQYYASVINAVAKAVPGVNVYNIAVPTAAEFYAPARMKIDQTSGIREIYRNLDESVIPINAVGPLMEHADEKIYFKTDHHWTQRGAYWVYREFAKIKGVKVPELSEFQNVPAKGFVGSFAGFARGTAAGNIMSNSGELLERFVPIYGNAGTAYSDMNMKNVYRYVKAVNTASNSYVSFIGGDSPVTVFYSTAPSDEVAVIIKESYGNAFATWALNNYKTVYVIDPRKFNGFGNQYFNKFNIATFCNNVGCDDLILINYPGAISSGGIRQAILDMTK